MRVGPTAMVIWETNLYSMPAEALGYSATLHLFRGRNRVSRLAVHRDGLLAAVSGERGRMYLQRQQLLELGKDAERVLTELVHVWPRRWPDDVERLHELLQRRPAGSGPASRPAARGLRCRNRPRSQRPPPLFGSLRKNRS